MKENKNTCRMKVTCGCYDIYLICFVHAQMKRFLEVWLIVPLQFVSLWDDSPLNAWELSEYCNSLRGTKSVKVKRMLKKTSIVPEADREMMWNGNKSCDRDKSSAPKANKTEKRFQLAGFTQKTPTSLNFISSWTNTE